LGTTRSVILIFFAAASGSIITTYKFERFEKFLVNVPVLVI